MGVLSTIWFDRVLRSILNCGPPTGRGQSGNCAGPRGSGVGDCATGVIITLISITTIILSNPHVDQERLHLLLRAPPQERL